MKKNISQSQNQITSSQNQINSSQNEINSSQNAIKDFESRISRNREEARKIQEFVDTMQRDRKMFQDYLEQIMWFVDGCWQEPLTKIVEKSFNNYRDKFMGFVDSLRQK